MVYCANRRQRERLIALTSVNKSAQRKAFRAAFAFELNPDRGTENFCFRPHLPEQNPDSETGNQGFQSHLLLGAMFWDAEWMFEVKARCLG